MTNTEYRAWHTVALENGSYFVVRVRKHVAKARKPWSRPQHFSDQSEEQGAVHSLTLAELGCTQLHEVPETGVRLVCCREVTCMNVKGPEMWGIFDPALYIVALQGNKERKVFLKLLFWKMQT